jgi:TolB-like protein/DNA-binding winged helix-turn-helix (wHTH) protein
VSQSCYKFGEFELNSARFELRRNAQVVKLERIPMELLILLLEKDGNVVSRQEIVERLWGKDVFVDTEHGINTAIRKIRTVLQEGAERPRFVLTILGKGYRFVTEPKNGNERSLETLQERVSAEPDVAVLSSTPIIQHSPEQAGPAAAGPVADAVPASRRHWWPWAVATVVLCLLAVTVLGLKSGGIRDRFLSASPRASIRSIAVLPLVNLSGDPSQDYFADGMTDELITMLAKNTSLRVVSRTSAMQYKGVNRPVRDIARALGVDGVLEGSVERSANRVHMTVQLIHGPSDTHIWAESYDRDLQSATSLPSELSQTIAKEVRTAVSAEHAKHPINPEAHDAYLHGRYFWFSDNYSRSEEYFRKAVELQPDYAAAWSGLADSYAVRAAALMVPPREVVPKAKAAAQKAIELDDSLPEAHNTLAALYLFGDWDLKRADEESQRVIAMNPNLAEGRHIRCSVLEAMNRLDESVQEQKREMELDPFARPWALGSAYMRARQFDAAVKELRLREEAQPHDVNIKFFLSDAYLYRGMFRESAQELERAFTAADDKRAAAEVRHAFESGGEKALAEWWQRRDAEGARKRYVSPWWLAFSNARLGRKEETLRYLEEAYREHTALLVFLQTEPIFDFLHSDERYRALVKKIGLPPAY